MDIVRDELFGSLDVDGDDGLEEVAEGHGVVPLGKEEVDTVVDFLDVDCVLVGAMLQNQLFQVQERPLMRHLLSDLYRRSPCVVGVALGAVWTLVVVLCELDLEALLHDGAFVDLRLHRDLDLYPPAVRLGPDEAGVDDSQLVESAQFSQAESEQFARFGVGDDPGRGRGEPSVTVAAHEQNGFARDAAGNVRLQFYAVVAEGTREGAVNRRAAVCAENGCGVLGLGRKRALAIHGDALHMCGIVST